MFRSLILSLLCLPSITGFTQLSIGHQLVQPAQLLEVNALPLLNNDLLISQELSKRTPNRAPVFAHSLNVNINPENAGLWEFLEDQAIWRIVIHSQSAYSINLGFSAFSLPEGASLFIYDFYEPATSDLFVPADKDEHEQLWTPIIASDKIVIEINIPKAKRHAIKLQLDYVNHDFVNILQSISESCNIDVSCGSENGYAEIDDYREQIRSVGLYTIAGTSICTGFLINNTRSDCTPYFMTAHHCNLTTNNAPTMVTYWNFENSYCRKPESAESSNSGDGTYEVFNSGASLLSTWTESDFTLVEFDDPIPEAANAYFSGWNVTNNLPDRGVIIHHPNLEEKRISFKQSPLYTGEWGSESTLIENGNHLVIDHWDLGTTQDGSSGAPLFNRQGLVVGQLHGGLASCDNEEYDSFGRMFSSWTGGGMPHNRLKDWLDPDNTGKLKLSGKNCVFELSLSENNIAACATDGFFSIDVEVDFSFVGQVQLTFEALPIGVSAFYNMDIIAPGQSASLTVANLGNLSDGEYSFNIVADDGQNIRKVRLKFDIYNQQLAQPDLVIPVHESIVDIEETYFKWKDADQVENYFFQLADNTAFDVNLIERNTNVSNLKPDFELLPNRIYYWRVKAANPCGESQWAPIQQFSTVEKSCVEEQSLKKEEILDSEPNVVYSVIKNDLPGTVLSVELSNVNGIHTFVSDLSMSLISPAGTEVLLIKQKCSSSEDFDMGFSDNGLAEISCPLTNNHVYKSAEKLSIFIGESGIGDWTLKIEDANKFDGGILMEWTLHLCVDPATDFSFTSNVDSLSICTNESFTLPLTIGSGYPSVENLTIESNMPDFARVQMQNEQFTLLINPSSMSMPGIYPVEVRINDNQANSATCRVMVEVITTPSFFSAQSPANEEKGIALSPNFTWENSQYATAYILEVSSVMDFTDIIIKDTVLENNYAASYELNANNFYFWKVTATNRCGKLSTEIGSFQTEKSSRVIDFQDDLVKVYPNPADQIINIVGDKVASYSPIGIWIYSVDGKCIYHKGEVFTGSTLSLDVSSWPKGVYTISIKTAHQVQNSRIVVQ